MSKKSFKGRLLSLLLCLALLAGSLSYYTVSLYSLDSRVTSPQVSVGNGFMVALDSYGIAYAWGDNTHGTLGNGTKTDSTSPVAVTMPNDAVFVKISAGYDHVLALSSAGQVYTWGSNGNRQLANDLAEDVTRPKKVGTLPVDKTFVSVAAGKCFSMALASDGTVYVWGVNDRGQLGISLNDTDMRFLPDTVPALQGIFATEIFAGDNKAAIITPEGTVWAWGDNLGGHLNYEGQSIQAPIEVGTSSVYFASAVALGTKHISFVELNGSVKSFGINLYGQFGNGVEPSEAVTLSHKSASFLEGVMIRQIALGVCHSVALSHQGKVYTWGDGSAQQLGFVSDQSRQLTPYEIALPIEDDQQAVWVDAGWNSSAVVDSNGFVWTFGENTSGQLGSGEEGSRVTPIGVAGIGGVGRLNLGKAPQRDVYNVSITANASIPAPSYSVSIPATLEVGSLRQKDIGDAGRISSTEFTLTVGNVENLFGEKKIAVQINTSNGAFELSDGDHKLAYSIYREGSETPLSPGDCFSEFDASGSVKGYVRIDQSTITRKGDYSGTLRFTFSVLPKESIED